MNRGKPLTSGGQLSINAAISVTMSQYLFVEGMSRSDLGTVLGLPGQSISSRMVGRTKWSAEEVALLAAYFGVTPNDLMPTPDGLGGWLPAPYRPARGDRAPELVPQVGLEPTTDGL